MMKEIGGYIELEHFRLPMFHEDAIALNCGRNALAYLIEANNIKKIWLPYFLCDSVKSVCRKYDVQIKQYHITYSFLPAEIEHEKEDWIYLVNYYGQLSDQVILEYKSRYKNIILDNAQNYFAQPLKDVNTLYTCRKYFGVSDGAFLYTNTKIERELEYDESFEHMRHILGRYERTASEFYATSVENNKRFSNEPIKKMSHLTNNLLHAIDYSFVEDRRKSNFSILDSRLGEINQLNLQRNIEVNTFMYPFMIDNAALIRKILQKQGIYIPTLWPNVLQEVPETWKEWKMAQNILPLPIDQRYNKNDMRDLVRELEKCIS